MRGPAPRASSSSRSPPSSRPPATGATPCSSESCATRSMPWPAYAETFAGSTDQDDYRWGTLHRIVLVHPLDDLDPSRSIPPAGGVSDLAATLRGFARDGTWDSVNVAGTAGGRVPNSSSGWLNATTNGLAYFRHVHALLRPSASGAGVQGFAVVPGGASGDPEHPHYASQLPLWLTADTHEVPMTRRAVRAAAKRVELFDPAPGP